jgi:hypothetical protein
MNTMKHLQWCLRLFLVFTCSLVKADHIFVRFTLDDTKSICRNIQTLFTILHNLFKSLIFNIFNSVWWRFCVILIENHRFFILQKSIFCRWQQRSKPLLVSFCSTMQRHKLIHIGNQLEWAIQNNCLVLNILRLLVVLFYTSWNLNSSKMNI